MNIFSNGGDSEFVPLGLNCDAAHFLRKKSLRRSAYPFDWNITPIRSAIELLANDFEGFLSETNLIFLAPVQRMLFNEDGTNLEILNEVITPVICARYRMLFPHDFSAYGRADLPAVRGKYAHRIQRLRDLMRSGREVWFIVQPSGLNDWQIDQYQSALGKPLEAEVEGWKPALSRVLEVHYGSLKYRLLDLAEFRAAIGTE